MSMAAWWFLLRRARTPTSTLLILHHLSDLVFHVVVKVADSSPRSGHSCPLRLLLPAGACKELCHGGLDGRLPGVHGVRRVGHRGGRRDRLVHRSARRFVRPPCAAGRTGVLNDTLDHSLVGAQPCVGVAGRSRLAGRPVRALLRITSTLPVLVLGTAWPRIWGACPASANLLADHVFNVLPHRPWRSSNARAGRPRYLKSLW